MYFLLYNEIGIDNLNSGLGSQCARAAHCTIRNAPRRDIALGSPIATLDGADGNRCICNPSLINKPCVFIRAACQKRMGGYSGPGANRASGPHAHSVLQYSSTPRGDSAITYYRCWEDGQSFHTSIRTYFNLVYYSL